MSSQVEQAVPATSSADTVATAETPPATTGGSGLQEDHPEAAWTAYRAMRSPENRNRLVEHYLPLVRRKAIRLSRTLPRRSLLGMDDLISYGVFGLMRSIERFDPARGVRFESFSHPSVMGAMVDALRQVDWVPRVARRQIQEAGQTVARVRSLDEVISESNRAQRESGEWILADKAGEEPGADLERQEFVTEFLDRCTDREREIVTLCYRDGLSIREAAERMGLSASAAHALRTRVLEAARRKHERATRCSGRCDPRSERMAAVSAGASPWPTAESNPNG